MTTPLAIAAAARWTGRILGVALVGICLTIAIGEGLPNPLAQPPAVQVGFLALALLLLGFLVGWFRESAGAILSLIGWGTFIVATVHRIRRPGFFLLLLALPAILFLVSALIRRRRGPRR